MPNPSTQAHSPHIINLHRDVVGSYSFVLDPNYEEPARLEANDLVSVELRAHIRTG